MWSIGVLVYVVLVGQMPFRAPSDVALLKMISQFKNMSFDTPNLAKRSIGCIDFMRKLLQCDPGQRPTAEQAGSHYWIRSLGQYTVDKDTIARSLLCFRNYKLVGQIQRMVVTYIVKKLFNDREADHYLKVFYMINRTSDGMCTKQ